MNRVKHYCDVVKIYALSIAALALAILSTPALAQMPPAITPPLTGSEIVVCYRANVAKSCTSAQLAAIAGSGTVTSVGLSLPAIFSVSGSPVTVAGTLTATLANQTTNKALASPNGSTGAPTFRTLVGPDLTYTPTGSGGVPLTQQYINDKSNWADSYGADPNGMLDSEPGIAAAFANTTGAVLLKGNYRLSSTLFIPGGRGIHGDSIKAGNPVTGTKLVCDLAVTPCVVIGDGSANTTSFMTGLAVTRSAGTPPSNSVGIKVWGGYQVTLENVQSTRSGICLWLNTSTSTVGIAFWGLHVNTSACVTTHVDVDSWPQARFSNSQFGQDGVGDFAATSYVRVRGGYASSAAGPNAVVFENSQFNQGDLATCPTYFMDFVNLTPGSIGSVSEFQLTDSHVECVAGAVFHSDSSWPTIDRMTIEDSVFITSTVPFFALNSATAINEWSMVGNMIFVSNITLAPAPADGIGEFYWAGGRMIGTTHLTGTAGSAATIVGVTHGGAVTYDGTWGSLSSIGENNTSGGFDYHSAIGAISVLGPAAHQILGGGGGNPSIGTCGTSPSVDGTSSDTAGIFTTGSGGALSACTITYAHAFPGGSFVTVTPASASAPAYYVISSASGFVMHFATDGSGTAWQFTATGH